MSFIESSRIELSIVILCWNDRKVIGDCLRSIYTSTRSTRFEVIVSDNGSTDDSVEFIRSNFPQVQVLENKANLRFSKGNNVGISVCKGRWILILNPDTIIHNGALDKWTQFANQHYEAGGFGCRVLNPDGSYQGCAQPFPTVWREWLAAFYLRPLGYISDKFICDTYLAWNGRTERLIDWQAGCALLVRGDLLKQLGGFDEQFRYYYEDVDLCKRIWNSGHTIIYTPEVCITHLGGQSTRNFRVAFEVDRYRNRYRYFYKYFGRIGALRCRAASLAGIRIRQLGYGLLHFLGRVEMLKERLLLYRAAAEWNKHVDPVRFAEHGEEPKVDSIGSGLVLPQ